MIAHTSSKVIGKDEDVFLLLICLEKSVIMLFLHQGVNFLALS